MPKDYLWSLSKPVEEETALSWWITFNIAKRLGESAMWGKCKRYVKETRLGVEVSLGGGYAGASGQIGVKSSPEERLADRTLLYLDISQHYYCTEVVEAERRARKAGGEDERKVYIARQIEMQKKRDDAFQKLVELAEKRKESTEAFISSYGKHREGLLGYGRDVASFLEAIEGQKVRTNMVRSTLTKLTELEQEMRQEEMKANIKIGEGWMKALGG
ncbi:MAG TPA: hypothetical protein ACFYED_00990 [Candidatus Tripitaka californicus]|uniref:hypothetical protein n=1 Tax=Candidatus Tripitaka californicus TaxID=3367616 RepID=UPI00402957C5